MPSTDPRGAAAGGEIVSPGDETFAKLPFYGAQGVVEVIVVLPVEQEVRCYDVTSGVGVQVPVSSVLGVDLQALTRDVDWPGNDESGAPAPS
jgi:hypothetical protein